MIWTLLIGTMALSPWALRRAESVCGRHSQGLVRSGLACFDLIATGAKGALGATARADEAAFIASPAPFLSHSPPCLSDGSGSLG